MRLPSLPGDPGRTGLPGSSSLLSALRLTSPRPARKASSLSASEFQKIPRLSQETSPLGFLSQQCPRPLTGGDPRHHVPPSLGAQHVRFALEPACNALQVITADTRHPLQSPQSVATCGRSPEPHSRPAPGREELCRQPSVGTAVGTADSEEGRSLGHQGRSQWDSHKGCLFTSPRVCREPGSALSPLRSVTWR